MVLHNLETACWDLALWASELPLTPLDATTEMGRAALYVAVFAAWAAALKKNIND